MHRARLAWLYILVACASAPVLWARSSSPAQEGSTARSSPDFSIQRALIDDSNAARNAGDYATARAIAAEVVAYLLARPSAEQDAAWLELLNSAGFSAWYAQDSRTASDAWKRVYEVRSRTLPDDHPELQWARLNLANTLATQGDLTGTRALEEKVLEVRSRTLPDDHPDLQKARGNLAITLQTQGDLAGARALQEKVLEVFSRTLPDDHPDLQHARLNLANTLFTQGDLAGARALYERVLEVQSRTLPDDHPDLQRARGNLANTLNAQGDLVGARALYEKVLEVFLRTLPDDHPDLQDARHNLANTLNTQGDLAGARALQEKVLEVFSRTLPDDHPDLQPARGNLANTLYKQGDLAGARALHEKVLEVRLRTLPDDHPDLQLERLNLATMVAAELAHERRSSGGEGERSREQERGSERCAELIIAVCRAQVQVARAAILASPGREAEERCASLTHALDGSLSFAQGFGVFEPLVELEAPSFVFAETTRGAAMASAELARRAAHSPRYAELRETLRAASDVLAELAQKGTTSEGFDRARVKREAAERDLVALARELSGGKESGAELDVESLAARLSGDEVAVSFRRFRKTRIEVGDELVSAGQPSVRDISVDNLCAFVVRSSKARSTAGSNGSAHGSATGAQYRAAQNHAAPTSFLTLVDLGPIAPIEAAARAWREAIGVGLERGMAAGDSETDVVEERGEELRRLVLDPLLPALESAERITLVLDDVLHIVPLDALPLAANAEHGATGAQLVGDRWQIQTRSTLTELLNDSPAPSGTALVALGGASFNVAPVALTAEEVASIEVVASDEASSAAEGTAPIDDGPPVKSAPPITPLRRGTAWERGFAPLTHTADEARGIGALYTEIYDDERPVLVLEKRKASREALQALAPKARFLHIATHGWFAPESIRAWGDAEPIDKLSGLGLRLSGAEQVKGMSPMLLCGLALAGANMPETATGRAPGLVTADELSTLDLSNCELAVLSACDTNVGERRAGQGVASLQKALQMAGARSVITSLWKVPDEATKELMLDFYRRLWVEKKPKHQALWEAKTKLREAKDERGAPKYTTRDWAAWVLTGAQE